MKDQINNKNQEVNTKFDTIIVTELKRRLNREPSPSELSNADTDSDLVNEVIWQLLNDVYNQLQEIKSQIKIKP